MPFRRPRLDLSARALASSVALGVLAAFLLIDLGAIDIFGLQRHGPFLSGAVVIAVALGVFGAAVVVVVLDAVLLATYLIVAFTPVMPAVASAWVRNDPVSGGPLAAVVVLSGWVRPDSSLETAAVERLLTGLELVKAGVAPRLITTRLVADLDGVRTTSDAGQQRLVHLAGLDTEWTEVDSVATTRHEAERVAALLLPAGSRDIAVVTSPMHTRRACAVFEAVGFRVRCVAAREMLYMTWHPSSASDRLAAFRDYAYERIGMVKYRYMGWVKPTSGL